MLGDGLAELDQEAAALGRGQLAPLALERLARRLDGAVDIFRPAARDLRERLAVRRTKHVDDPAIRRADAGAADEVRAEGKRGGGADVHGRLLKGCLLWF